MEFAKPSKFVPELVNRSTTEDRYIRVIALNKNACQLRYINAGADEEWEFRYAYNLTHSRSAASPRSLLIKKFRLLALYFSISTSQLVII